MKDTYNRNITYMRLSVTELCNLRCLYCMPEGGIPKKSHLDMLTEEETVCAVETAAELGIRKLRITGGEPLTKRNILSLCEKCGAVSGIETLCLTTNGILLPPMAKDLKAAGVKNINISLDTLNPEKYKKITRIGSLDEAMKGIDCALNTGFQKIKINAVLIGGFNDDEIRDLAKLTVKYPVDVRFIELMPMVDHPDFDESCYVPGSRVLEELQEAKPVPSEQGSVARLYHLPDAKGNLGLINPLSSHFCAECNRIRLTADGKLKPCLHSSAEFLIKGLDRAEMKKVMKEAILAKPECHAPLSSLEKSKAGRYMYQIGG